MFGVHRTLTAEDGQDLLEYGLLASLIALAAVGVAGLLGQQIYTVFWQSIGASI
jgi:Flp pilus assembly pilin Flp